MSKLRLLVLLLIVTLVGGCVLSFYPLFPEKNAVYDPGLLGTWTTKRADLTSDEEKEATFTISHHPQLGKTYNLQTDIKDQRQEGRFLAQIGVIGTNRFLQLIPRRPDNIHPKSLYGGHFIQGWSFWKLKLDRDKLELVEMNYLWLESMLKQKKLEIKHEQQEGGFIVLTASTPELQAFVSKYADDPGAFGKGIEFDRQK